MRRWLGSRATKTLPKSPSKMLQIRDHVWKIKPFLEDSRNIPDGLVAGLSFMILKKKLGHQISGMNLNCSFARDIGAGRANKDSKKCHGDSFCISNGVQVS